MYMCILYMYKYICIHRYMYVRAYIYMYIGTDRDRPVPVRPVTGAPPQSYILCMHAEELQSWVHES